MTGERRWTFLEECPEAFLVVFAVVELTANGLETLIRSGAEGPRGGQLPQFLLEQGEHQGRIPPDIDHDLTEGRLQGLRRNDPIHHARVQAPNTRLSMSGPWNIYAPRVSGSTPLSQDQEILVDMGAGNPSGAHLNLTAEGTGGYTGTVSAPLP